MGNLYDADISELISFARAYNDLGWAIQDQLLKLLDGRPDGINPNAIWTMKQTLRGFNGSLDDALDDYLESCPENKEEE